jgi:hypothetical protein
MDRLFRVTILEPSEQSFQSDGSEALANARRKSAKKGCIYKGSEF